MSMSHQEILEILKEASENSEEEILLADGLDEALIGLCQRYGQQDVAAYSFEKVISIFMERDGMTYDEAVEYFDFNVIGAWVGDGTPAFIRTFEEIAVNGNEREVEDTKIESGGA
jgi:hypothetical protein